VNGPKTQASIGRILEAWSGGSGRVAFILPPDSAIAKLQYKRMADTHGANRVRVFLVPDEAFAWCATD
jgi:hypothetical protein